jgi:UTP--glucose-1-phosphate uridylyltransferase
VLHADDLIASNPGVIARMATLHESVGCSLLGVEQVPREQTSSYGIVSVEDADAEATPVRSIVEKPAPDDAPSTLAVVGRYVLTPGIFPLLADARPGRGGEIQLTDAIARLLASEKVLAMRLPGRRFDCGSKLGYLEATVEYGLRHPETGAAFAAYLRQRLG